MWLLSFFWFEFGLFCNSMVIYDFINVLLEPFSELLHFSSDKSISEDHALIDNKEVFTTKITTLRFSEKEFELEVLCAHQFKPFTLLFTIFMFLQISFELLLYIK